MTDDAKPGVRFPTTDGSRSTSATGAALVADSLVGVDPAAAERARACAAWRKQYVDHFAASTRLSASKAASVGIARAGLAAVRERMVVAGGTGAEVPLGRWAAGEPGERRALTSREVRGEGERLRRVEVPYRGEVLHGAALERQLDAWVAGGVLEPGFADAVRLVLAHPEWLPLPDHRVVLVGAGAALGPLAELARWGADVVAVDVPSDRVTERLVELATRGAGRVELPVDAGTGEAGVDVAVELGAVRGWLAERHDGPVPVLGTHGYADGAAHVELTAATDLLAEDVVRARPDGVLAYLHTPTDTFLAPAEAVAHAKERAGSLRWNGPAHRAGALVSGRRLFTPAYAETLTDEDGGTWGLTDTLVDVQGPNYALAKRIQRWRAVVQADAGTRVSSTVAPASWTRSVTKNRVLAAVYAGAAPFGVEIFEAGTTRALTAAKLVADVAGPAPERAPHPEAIFAAAAHGGLWRQPFEPRSALGFAAVLGAPRLLLGRTPR